MKINQTDLITVARSRKPGHCQSLGGSDARIILRLDEAALIRGLGGHSRAHAAKSPTAQALLLRPIRGKHSRATHKQLQTAAKLPTLMSGIRRLLKAYAILWQELYARFSEHTFDQGNRVLVSRVSLLIASNPGAADSSIGPPRPRWRLDAFSPWVPSYFDVEKTSPRLISNKGPNEIIVVC
jgi:hypothetical protein